MQDASTTTTPSPQVICGQHLDGSLSTPPGDPSPNLARPPIVRLHVINHADCGIDRTEPLTAHLRAGCAKHIRYPSLRRDERYLPPNKPSTNSAFARFPYRKTMRATRGSQSPPKRSASGSVSPSKDSRYGNETAGDEDVTELVAPPALDIPVEDTRQIMAGFRDSCLGVGTKCAVTGKGRSWYMNPSVGPAVQACHIVPQQHYHVYPVPSSFADHSRFSSRRLREAWDRTWSPKNGLLLLSHLHELFDARLFSIHPDTMRIRVFVPYDVILDYHGCVAQLPLGGVDHRALRHHYEMCCIENMTAEMPLSEFVASEAPSRSAASGTISPFESGSHTPIIRSMTSANNASCQGVPGDPSKRPRPAPGEPGDEDQSTNDVGPLTADGSSAPSTLRHGSAPPNQTRKREEEDMLNEAEEHGCKKRRRIFGRNETVCVYDDESESEAQYHDPYWDGCITPWNSQTFLAGVDWELANLRDSG